MAPSQPIPPYSDNPFLRLLSFILEATNEAISLADSGPVPPISNPNWDRNMNEFIKLAEHCRVKARRLGLAVDEVETALRKCREAFAELHRPRSGFPRFSGDTHRASALEKAAQLRLTTVPLGNLADDIEAERQPDGLTDRNEAHTPPAGVISNPATAELGQIRKKNREDVRPPRSPNKPSQDRQNDILAAIQNAGTPLTRPELVETMRLQTEGKLGHQLAWLVASNILINIPQRGYWPANLPVPELPCDHCLTVTA
jgi:hypothetical protein